MPSFPFALSASLSRWHTHCLVHWCDSPDVCTRFLADLEHVLTQTRERWEALRGERLFVTGGTRFVDARSLETFAFANQQLGLGAHLVALTRGPEAFRERAPHLAANPAITLVAGDVRDSGFRLTDSAASSTLPRTSSRHVPPLEHLDTIIHGTRRVLDFARACGARKFLLVSSGAVYGPQPAAVTHLPEDFPGAPRLDDPRRRTARPSVSLNCSARSIAASAVREEKIARCFAFIGPHLPLETHFAAGNFLRDALRGGPIRVNGDGAPVRSYLHAADLVVWLWTILFKGQSGRAYNVGSGEPIHHRQPGARDRRRRRAGNPRRVAGQARHRTCQPLRAGREPSRGRTRPAPAPRAA